MGMSIEANKEISACAGRAAV
ncbi:hypothetical protein AAFN90_13910 [Erwiniaceae bacterium CAU 1747]